MQIHREPDPEKLKEIASKFELKEEFTPLVKMGTTLEESWTMDRLLFPLKNQDDPARVKLLQDTLRYGYSEFWASIPFYGRLYDRYKQARTYEALAYFNKSGDIVVDAKMERAAMIRDQEVRFGWVTGMFFGGIAAFLPALKGASKPTRLFYFMVPFSLSCYRGFRRGYDQILYVGETYHEIVLKQKVLLDFLGETQDYLVEFKEAIADNPEVQRKMRLYGVKPFA